MARAIPGVSKETRFSWDRVFWPWPMWFQQCQAIVPTGLPVAWTLLWLNSKSTAGGSMTQQSPMLAFGCSAIGAFSWAETGVHSLEHLPNGTGGAYATLMSRSRSPMPLPRARVSGHRDGRSLLVPLRTSSSLSKPTFRVSSSVSRLIQAGRERHNGPFDRRFCWRDESSFVGTPEWARGCQSVGEGGLEPPHPFGHRNLNPARLPIPPLARATGVTIPDRSLSVIRGVRAATGPRSSQRPSSAVAFCSRAVPSSSRMVAGISCGFTPLDARSGQPRRSRWHR